MVTFLEHIPNCTNTTLLHMNNKHFILITLLLSGLNLFSQSNFKEGYIVNLQGDTLKGYVDYNTASQNTKRCTFKLSIEGKSTIYTPTEISSYSIVGVRHFDSRYLEVADNNKVFIEKIISGNISLFKYHNSFFVQKNDTVLIPLERKVLKNVYKGAKKGNINTNKHLGILLFLMNDKPELKSEIGRTLLNERSLTDLISKYNMKIGGPSQAFKSNLKWTKFQFSLKGGYLFSKLKINSNEHGIDYLLNGWDLAYAPTVGVSVDISSPRLYERVKLTIGGNYYYTNYLTQHIQEEGNQEIRSNVKLEISTISIPLGLKYTIPINTFDLNFGIGIAFTITQEQTLELEQDIINGDVTSYYTRSNFLDTRRQESYWLNMSINKPITNKLDGIIEFRIDKGRGISEEIIFEDESYAYRTWVYPHTTNIQILIGIQF